VTARQTDERSNAPEMSLPAAFKEGKHVHGLGFKQLARPTAIYWIHPTQSYHSYVLPWIAVTRQYTFKFTFISWEPNAGALRCNTLYHPALCCNTLYNPALAHSTLLARTALTPAPNLTGSVPGSRCLLVPLGQNSVHITLGYCHEGSARHTLGCAGYLTLGCATVCGS